MTPSNAMALCFSCHQYTGENPVEGTWFFEQQLGADGLSSLFIMAHTIEKKSKASEAERVKELRSMIEAME